MDEDEIQFSNMIPDYDMFAGNADFEEVANRRNESAFRFDDDDGIDFTQRFSNPEPSHEENVEEEKEQKDIQQHDAMVFELEHDSEEKPDVRFV